MKNLIKFGFLAMAITLSLAACGDGGKPAAGDKNPVDSVNIDSPKTDSLKIDSAKNPVDSANKAEKK